MGRSRGWRPFTFWPHKNISTMRANGGFIQISKVLICHWGIDLISSRHYLPCNDCNKKQEKNHRCPRTLTEITHGHRILPHGGIGKVHGKRSDAVHHEIKMLNIDNEAIHERVEENMNFKNFRITTFCCEACAEYQRSRIDSENWETSKPTRCSTRPTTKSSL